METYYGLIQKNNQMAAGGEASRFTLTGQNNVTIEVMGDDGGCQNCLGRWVNATGRWQEVGVENKRQVFFISSIAG